MTKKDYIKFANMLKVYAKDDNTPAQIRMLQDIVTDTANIFKEDNPLFDEDKFRKAIYKN